MKSLIINAGSSSLKFSLIETHGERELADGGVVWVQKPARLTIRRGDHAAAYEGLDHVAGAET